MILPSSGVMRTAYPKSSAKTFIALKGEQVTYMGISMYRMYTAHKVYGCTAVYRQNMQNVRSTLS